MANLSPYFKFIMPEESDYYDISQYNQNIALLDKELNDCVRASSIELLPHFRSGSYIGSGAESRNVVVMSDPKIVMILKDGQILGIATAALPYLSGDAQLLGVTGNGFSLASGFANEDGVSYGYVCL